MSGLHRFPWNSLRFLTNSNYSNVKFQLCSNLGQKLALNTNLHRSLTTTSQCCGRTFVHVENIHAHSLIKKNPSYEHLLFRPDEVEKDIIAKNIKLHPASQNFIDISLKKDSPLLPLDSDCYVDVINEVVGNLKSFSDSEILLLLHAMERFPFSNSPKSPQFHKLWKSIDLECVSRLKSGIWSVDEMFVMDDAWYPMDLTRFCNFHWEMIKRNFRKCDQLNKEQFVRFMFCLNRTRKIHDSINTYELEYNLQRLFPEMNAEELCVVSLALFKTQTPIRNFKLLDDLLDKVMASASTLQSVSVAGISKIIRLSVRHSSHETVLKFLEVFVDQVDRLSVTACIHLALAGTKNNVYHEGIMTKIIQKVEDNIKTTRLKELEKITLATSMFNVKCPSLWNLILNELRNPGEERALELEEYGRCLSAILHYFTFQELYPLDLINKVLSPEFIKKYYGKNLYHYQRELLCLDLTTEIEIPEYSGHRLPLKARNYLLKNTTFWVYQDDKAKVTAFKSCLRSLTNVIEDVFDARGKILVGGILPQFHTVEVLFCTDLNGTPADIPEYIRNKEQFELKFIQKNKDGIPDSENTVFHVFTLASHSNTINKTDELGGNATLRERQMAQLGYTLHRITMHEWLAMKDEARNVLMKDLILSACEKQRNKK